MLSDPVDNKNILKLNENTGGNSVILYTINSDFKNNNSKKWMILILLQEITLLYLTRFSEVDHGSQKFKMIKLSKWWIFNRLKMN